MATAPRPPNGRLIESAQLVATGPAGERDPLLQVMLSHTLDGHTWCVELLELPRGGRRTHQLYTRPADAYAALDRVYDAGDPAGQWQVSRFGNDPLRQPTAGNRPRW